MLLVQATYWTRRRAHSGVVFAIPCGSLSVPRARVRTSRLQTTCCFAATELLSVDLDGMEVVYRRINDEVCGPRLRNETCTPRFDRGAAAIHVVAGVAHHHPVRLSSLACSGAVPDAAHLTPKLTRSCRASSDPVLIC